MSRPKGSKNRITIETKEVLTSILENNYTKIETELNEMKGKAYIDAIFKIVEYVIPKAKEEETAETNIPKLSIKLVGINDK